MVDVDRLITVELKPPVHLLPVERLGLLLRHPDEDNAVTHLSLPAEVVGDVVLSLFVLELVDRYVLSRSACAFTASRNLSDTCPRTTGDGTGIPNWKRMNIDSPGPVASLPM